MCLGISASATRPWAGTCWDRHRCEIRESNQQSAVSTQLRRRESANRGPPLRFPGSPFRSFADQTMVRLCCDRCGNEVESLDALLEFTLDVTERPSRSLWHVRNELCQECYEVL